MNMDKPDANWWSFSIDERERGEKIRSDEAAGTVEVNPGAGGRRLLSYHQYLGLGGLLNCQVPGSRAPEERVFIITHQLFELVFKQMIFDFRVIAETLRSLLARSDADFRWLVDLPAGDNPVAAAGFWGPALTAAARVKHGAGNVLPWLMAYLAHEETFSNEEFTHKFRDNLWPASGFQSAQFRLIQRALGKSCLLDVRLFPADAYLKAYEGKSDAEVGQLILTAGNAGLATVVDPLILREGLAVATPPAGSELASVAGLDDLAHRALARVALLDESESGGGGGECRLALLPARDDKGAAVEEKFVQRLRAAVVKRKSAGQQPVVLTDDELRMIARRGEVFRQDWLRAVDRENRRREQHRTACRGAALLLRDKREGPLASILARLVAADRDLYGKFLLFHQSAVARRIGEVPGTAGGGVPYLDFSRELIGLFPALAHFRERDEITPQGV